MDLREHLNADSKGPRGKKKVTQQLCDFKKGERCLEESTQVCTEDKGRKFNNIHLKQSKIILLEVAIKVDTLYLVKKEYTK